MAARRPPSGHRRKGLAKLLPDPPQALKALPYSGLRHGYDPEAAARAALLVQQGYGALELWLGGPEAHELWRQQRDAARQKRLLGLDWG